MDKQQLREYMDAVKKEGVLVEGSLLVPASVLSELLEAANIHALEDAQREAAIATERKDCDKALLALAGRYPTPVEGYGTNSSWAISDLCRALEASEAQRDRLEKALREIVKFSKAHRTILIGSLVDVQREDIIGRAAEAVEDWVGSHEN